MSVVRKLVRKRGSEFEDQCFESYGRVEFAPGCLVHAKDGMPCSCGLF